MLLCRGQKARVETKNEISSHLISNASDTSRSNNRLAARQISDKGAMLIRFLLL
jgi:hypothetical protein